MTTPPTIDPYFTLVGLSYSLRRTAKGIARVARDWADGFATRSEVYTPTPNRIAEMRGQIAKLTARVDAIAAELEERTMGKPGEESERGGKEAP